MSAPHDIVIYIRGKSDDESGDDINVHFYSKNRYNVIRSHIYWALHRTQGYIV